MPDNEEFNQTTMNEGRWAIEIGRACQRLRIRRGKRLAAKLETTISYWSKYTMFKDSERELHFPLAVCVSYQQGKRRKQGLLVRAYAACNQPDRTSKQIETFYRKRSAIETSFRMFREARATTTTQDPTVRLVFVLVGFLLRNLWLVVRWGENCPPGSDSRCSINGLTTTLMRILNAAGKHRLTVSVFPLPIGLLDAG